MTSISKIRVLVVDDHPIVRDGLKSVLQTVRQVDLVKVCSTGEEVLETLSRQSVDVILADLRMAPMSGLELLGRVTDRYPSTKMIVFSSYEREEEIYQAFIGGAAGYLNKNMPSEQLVSAIVAASAGKRLFSVQDVAMCEERRSKKGLTSRELQILEMLAKGLTNKEIGDVLCISYLTARNLVKRVCTKLDASDRTEATRIAIERGIILVD
jgi:DNA-binding NarL/FixJ family response regulator